MNLKLLVSSSLTLLALFCASSVDAAKEARVTHIIRDVKVLPEQADPRPAALNDRIAEDTGVRTGDQSRSELTFPDFTITRLGANSLFSFDKAGRTVDLGGGSILLRVPKDSGGARISAPAVSVAVTGTTLILETQRGGRSKLIVLEGAARLALKKNAAQNKNVLAGQMLDVPAGATTLPNPVNIDLNQLMRTHPLIVGFPPLPSRDVIAAAANRRPPDEPVYQGRPVAGGPSGGIGIGGIPLPPFFGGGGGRSGGGGSGGGTRNPSNPPGSAGQPPPGPNTPGAGGGRVGGGGVSGVRTGPIKRAPIRQAPKPTPPPIR